VRRSAYARSATAIGLAIQADQPESYRLSEGLTRFFGVWREADSGSRIIFDPLLEKGTPLPAPGEPREWNLQERERLAATRAGQDVAGDEEWSFLFLYPREFASTDGVLPIDFDGLVRKIERYAEQAEYAIIQGAGGLLTPVTWEWNMADVARAVEDELGVPVCDGVAYPHETGLVHRDLKPHNDLFIRPDVPKVSDFGLAKVITGKAVGYYQLGQALDPLVSTL